MNTFSTNFRIFCALMRRNYKIVTEDKWATLLDKLILVTTYVVIFGHFYPLMGMPVEYVAPVFLGNLLLLLFSVGSSISLSVLFDLQYQQYINYVSTLPLPKRWLFGSYIIDITTQLIITTLPLFFFGTLLLGDLFPIYHINWPYFLLVYTLSCLILSFLLLSLSFWYSYGWYMANVWPRRLNIFLTFAPLFVTWKQTYSFSHLIGMLFLINPLTYIVEGLRGSVLGSTAYLPFMYVLCGLLISLACVSLWFIASIKKRLDPV